MKAFSFIVFAVLGLTNAASATTGISCESVKNDQFSMSIAQLADAGSGVHAYDESSGGISIAVSKEGIKENYGMGSVKTFKVDILEVEAGMVLKVDLGKDSVLNVDAILKKSKKSNQYKGVMLFQQEETVVALDIQCEIGN